MLRRNRKLLLGFICSFLLVFYGGTQAQAYVRNGYVLSNPGNVKYGISNTAGTYTSIITTYASKWDSYCPEISMSMGTAENIYFYGDLSVINGTYAVTYHSSNDSHVITLYASFTTATSAQKNETIVHEVGHALGLAHCQESKNEKSVMRESGFNGKAYPLSDDKEGISAIY